MMVGSLSRISLRVLQSSPIRTISTQSRELDFEIAVIGAGVVGLAIARELQLLGKEVVLIEACNSFGSQTSSRNSEVIHAGIYYPPASLKAMLCVDGRQKLYRYCERRHVENRRLGKLIVATEESHLSKLKQLKENAELNGVDNLEWLSTSQASIMQPGLSCQAALYSPSTGIIDSHGLMSCLQADFVNNGGTVAFNSIVVGGKCSPDEHEIVVRTNDEPQCTPFSHIGTSKIARNDTVVRVSKLVNSGGLFAQEISKSLKIPDESIPELYIAKGNYFTLSHRSLFHAGPFNKQRKGSNKGPDNVSEEAKQDVFKINHLVYPIPTSGGLGVHLTVDLSGGIKFGPDVVWLPRGTKPDTLRYDVDLECIAQFEKSIKSWMPDLPSGSLVPDYSGMRPKIVPPEGPAGDFAISGPRDHGISGFVGLYGIESPGLTSSLSLAELVARRLYEN